MRARKSDIAAIQSSTDHIAGLDSAEQQGSISYVVRAYVGHDIKILGWTHALVQPPGESVDCVGEVFISHGTVTIVIGSGCIRIQGICCRGCRFGQMVNDMWDKLIAPPRHLGMFGCHFSPRNN